ncbi:MAG: recombination mediator RecR [Phycisphaerales bacterium]|nr:recombination mediator RecR [Phycisphaerales bacterium]
MQLSSALLQNVVEELSKLPGIGKKSALKLSLHLLKQSRESVQQLNNSIQLLKEGVQFCSQCHNLSDQSLCSICSNVHRNRSVICVVEGIQDAIAIENTQQYNGIYHILGGVIAPLDGVSPDQLTLEHLITRLHEEPIQEIIFALSPNIQGDTTIFYIKKKIRESDKYKMTTIARGVSFGGELEYADEFTLAKSIQNRIPIQQYVQ